MTIKFGMIAFGLILIYAGWKNLSVQALLFGDNTVKKTGSGFPQTPIPGGSQQTTTSTGSSSSTPQSGGSSSSPYTAIGGTGPNQILVGPHGRIPFG